MIHIDETWGSGESRPLGGWPDYKKGPKSDQTQSDHSVPEVRAALAESLLGPDVVAFIRDAADPADPEALSPKRPETGGGA